MGTSRVWLRCHRPDARVSTPSVDWLTIRASNPPVGPAATTVVPAGSGASVCQPATDGSMTDAERSPWASSVTAIRPPAGVTPVDTSVLPAVGSGGETDQLTSPSLLVAATSSPEPPVPALIRAVAPDGVARRRTTRAGPPTDPGSDGPTECQVPS